MAGVPQHPTASLQCTPSHGIAQHSTPCMCPAHCRMHAYRGHAQPGLPASASRHKVISCPPATHHHGPGCPDSWCTQQRLPISGCTQQLLQQLPYMPQPPPTSPCPWPEQAHHGLHTRSPGSAIVPMKHDGSTIHFLLHPSSPTPTDLLPPYCTGTAVWQLPGKTSTSHHGKQRH